jgi:hypothetical protein
LGPARPAKAEAPATDALDPLQRNAWLQQITLLQKALRELGDGWIALEFAIPRVGKRVDTIVICQGFVFVVEFKMGTKHFDASGIDQVTDYALDLKNFHAGSHRNVRWDFFDKNRSKIKGEFSWWCPGEVPHLCLST